MAWLRIKLRVYVTFNRIYFSNANSVKLINLKAVAVFLIFSSWILKGYMDMKIIRQKLTPLIDGNQTNDS